MKKAWVSCAALLAAAVATAHGDPTLNGCREDGYVRLWTQSQPTTFGDNQPGSTVCPPPGLGVGISISLNNSNTLGLSGTGCDASTGAGVTTGAEYKIPFSTLGNPTAANLLIAGFVNGGGGDFLANQIIGAPQICANPGEPRNVDFSDEVAFPGSQFVTVSNSMDVVLPGDAPTIDGTLDATFYGAALFTNSGGTQFGDSTDGMGGGGSEIDAVWARVATVDGVKSLYVFVAGNLETNFNKYDLFVDTGTTDGQNTLRGDNADVDFNQLNRMGSSAPDNGLTFDTGFTADRWLRITNGGDPRTMYVNFAELATTGGGPGLFLGSVVVPGTFTSVEDPCEPMPLPIPGPDIANGSELDTFSVAHCNGNLYLFFAGNLSSDGTKLEIFFDVGSVDGDAGQNQLRGNNVDIDFNGLNRMGDDTNTTEVEGLIFDADFSANYWLSVITRGLEENTDAEIFMYAAQLRANGINGAPTLPLDYGGLVGGPKSNPMFYPLSFDGQYCIRNVMDVCMPHNAGTAFNPLSLIGLDVQGDLQIDGAVNGLPTLTEAIRTSYAPRLLGSGQIFDPLGTQMGNPNVAFTGKIAAAIDNSNIDGITGTTASMVAAEAVGTGVEIKVGLDELGWEGGPIKIVAFLNGTNRDLISNQVIGASVGAANVGDPRLSNFGDELAFPGSQYIEIADVALLPCPTGANCPEPNPPCPGDYNDDNTVDLADLIGFNTDWQPNIGTMQPAGTNGDYNGDGMVDLADLIGFNTDWQPNIGVPCP